MRGSNQCAVILSAVPPLRSLRLPAAMCYRCQGRIDVAFLRVHVPCDLLRGGAIPHGRKSSAVMTFGVAEVGAPCHVLGHGGISPGRVDARGGRLTGPSVTSGVVSRVVRSNELPGAGYDRLGVGERCGASLSRTPGCSEPDDVAGPSLALAWPDRGRCRGKTPVGHGTVPRRHSEAPVGHHEQVPHHRGAVYLHGLPLLLMVSARVIPGASGGAVIGEGGKLVGMAVSNVAFRGSMWAEAGLCLPSELLAECLRDMGGNVDARQRIRDVEAVRLHSRLETIVCQYSNAHNAEVCCS